MVSDGNVVNGMDSPYWGALGLAVLCLYLEYPPPPFPIPLFLRVRVLDPVVRIFRQRGNSGGRKWRENHLACWSRLFTWEFVPIMAAWLYGYIYGVGWVAAAIKRLCEEGDVCRDRGFVKDYKMFAFARPLASFGGRYEMDVSDIQWRSYRESLPIISGVALLFVLLGRMLCPTPGPSYRQPELVKDIKSSKSLLSSTSIESLRSSDIEQADLHESYYFILRKEHLNLALGVVFVSYVHGFGIIYHAVAVFVMHFASYPLDKHRNTTILIWVTALSMLIIKEPKWGIKNYLAFTNIFGGKIGGFMDSYDGVYSWHLSINLAILRLLSYALDRQSAHEQQNSKSGKPSSKQGSSDNSDTPLTTPNQDLSQRMKTPLPIQSYTYVNALSHLLYPPFFLAGPTVSFNTYMSYCGHRDRSRLPITHQSPLHGHARSNTEVATYIAKVVVALWAIEVVLHHMPIFAANRAGLLKGADIQLQCTAVLATLNVMWLKFTVMWRLARSWALLDGMDVPENMLRSVNSTDGVGAFWKGWHASFNRWIVRYMYIPMGGSGGRWWNVWIVFGFVALWHDADVNLLAWGALNAAFFVMEKMVGGIWKKNGGALLTSFPTLHRHLSAIGRTSLVFLLIAVNCIGYSIGLNKTGEVVQNIFFSKDGIMYILKVFVFLYSQVHINTELRSTTALGRPQTVKD